MEKTYELERDLRKHHIRIVLGPCFRSDYAVHAWVGDDRTPPEQIIQDGREILSCCYRPEARERVAREKVEEALSKRRAAVEAEARRRAEIDAELYVVTDDAPYPRLRVFHSLQAEISRRENIIRISTSPHVGLMARRRWPYHTAEDLRPEAEPVGFVWNDARKALEAPYSEALARAALDLVRRYDTKASAEELNAAPCVGCGRWLPAEDLEDGYCGC